METIYLLIGSNQGNSLKILGEAVIRIELLGTIVKTSSKYVTKAWGKSNQPDFLNQAIELESDISPVELLENLKKIEEDLGKRVLERWGPRTIDIDILFYGQQKVNTPTLTIPHPRIQERKFVLIPLKEINPDLIHPVYNKSIKQLEESCPDNLEVTKLN